MRRLARCCCLASCLAFAVPVWGGGQTPGCQPGPGPHRWYVDASATGGADNGLSWGDAFRHLQRALQLAHQCSGVDEIWVAAGTYYPDRTPQFPQGSGDPEATFQMHGGVAIYGGFLGLHHPGLPGGETELSQRDPVHNLAILSGDIAGNSHDPPPPDTYHVVTAENGATGILDGFTITGGNALAGSGGGLYVLVASPTIAGCTFRGNRAARGGGAYIWTYDFEIAPTFVNCSFLGNAAQASGGGGAAVESTVFVYCETSIVNATFINCLFSGNTAASGGGALSITKLVDCTTATATLLNCTLSQNLAAGGAGAIDGIGECAAHGAVAVYNSIVWGNGSPQIDGACLDVTITGSDVQDQRFGKNLSLDPLFCDPPGADGAAGTADDNLRLRDGSPCIDAGSDRQVTVPWDRDGQPRQFDATGGAALVDMGAYENQHIAGCPWDLNGDGAVDAADLGLSLVAWGACPGCAADLECDLAVDVNDFLELLQRWGACP